MRIRTQSDLSLPWDHSSDTFNTDDNDEASLNTTTQLSETSIGNTPQPAVTINPYQTQNQPPPRANLLTTLTSWILPRRTAVTAPVTDTPAIPTIIEIPANDPHQPPTPQSRYHQPLLSTNSNNNHWGDIMINPKPFQTFRILSRNVNTLSTQQNYLQWKAASQALASCEVDAIALQETNVSWDKIHRQKISQILRKPTGHATTATSSSTEISTKSHQCGGTLQAIVGGWASRVVESGKDPSGLGRWSYTELQGRDNKRFIILSGYRVCDNQSVDMGSNNTYNQQYRLLHQQGYRNPDPRSTFLDDLIKQTKIWRAQHKAVLICIDANDNPQHTTTTGVTRLFSETDLIDLHTAKHPNQNRPPTYNRGSTPIDLCAGSPEFAEALVAAWYLPFGLPTGLKGDHQTLGLDFNSDRLFHQQITTIYKTPLRGVYSNNTTLVEKFCAKVIKASQEDGIYERIHSLASQQSLTTDDHKELDNIDRDLTRLLVKADQTCVKAGSAPWSPQLHEAYLIHHYWTLKLSQHRTGRNYPNAFNEIEIKIPPAKLHPAHLTTISQNLRAAQKLLHEIQKVAKEKRQAHLEDLIKAAGICKDQRKKKLILCLKRAEELRHCYAMVRSITKPQQKGGISHVKIPNATTPNEITWTTLYDPSELETAVLQQHRQHFSQATGTPFTVTPLRELINDECTSEYAIQILNGTANINDLPIDEYTKDLLTQLKTKVPPTENPTLPLDPEALIQGFKVWPERTSTSPSGRHLGIYKSLAKHFPPTKDKGTDDIPVTPPDPIQSGNDILKLIIMMMELAVTHTHTFERWKTIWTLLLEKDPGDPKID